jgi:uncharacterized protein YndB with AHSA1/START domain
VSGADALEFVTELAAPQSRVFASLTEARHLERWFCDRATSDPQDGGALMLAWTGPHASAEPFRGRWIAWDPPRRCGYQGGHSGYPDGDAGTVVFALEPHGPGTRLTTQHRFPEHPDFAPIRDRYRDAWPRALGRLTAYLTPEPPR